MAEEREIDRAAEPMESTAEELERRNEQLGRHAEETREEWERKRADDSVPGAPPREDDQTSENPWTPERKSEE
jgi:hypothetical protein